MARGFESKDVEFQQAEADRGKAAVRPTLTSGERDTREKLRTLELTLARARGDLGAARSSTHRDMLTGAIAALEEQLQRLT